MARAWNRLTARQAETLGDGRHADGGGIYLCVTGQRRRWLWRYVSPRTGKVREAGLGSAHKGGVTLAEARRKAAEMREAVREGRDPLDEPARRKTVTFGALARELHEMRAPTWKSDEHRREWLRSLEIHAAALMDRPVDGITTDDVLAVLRPIWTTRHETATRVRGRLEDILAAATVRGLRAGQNPAAWKGHLALILPAIPRRKRRRHHAAVDWREAPEAMAKIRATEGIAPVVLQFAILTAARSGEARGATWAEIDLAGRVWTIPGHRMKAGRVHRVPLSEAAIVILKAVRPVDTPRPEDFVFRGPLGRALTGEAVAKAMKRAGVEATVHGWRSTFRDWAAEAYGAPWELCELALAHTIGDAAVQAYARSDLLERRRPLMEAWARYITGEAAATVIPLPVEKAS